MAADELELLKAKIQDLGGEIAGVIRSEGLLEALPEFPIAVTYLTGGRPVYSLGRGALGFYTFHFDLHLSRAVLPNDEAELIPFVVLVYSKFAGWVTLGGLCEHCLIQEFTIGGFNYGRDQLTYGIRFVMEVKLRHSGITVAASS